MCDKGSSTGEITMKVFVVASAADFDDVHYATIGGVFLTLEDAWKVVVKRLEEWNDDCMEDEAPEEVIPLPSKDEMAWGDCLFNVNGEMISIKQMTVGEEQTPTLGVGWEIIDSQT